MSQPHLPRSLVIVLFILVAGTFLAGILLAFTPAHALSDPAFTRSGALASKTPLPTLAVTNTNQAGSGDAVAPTPVPTPVQTYADTTGVIALAILLVVVMLFGMAWGGRGLIWKKGPKK